MKQQTAVESFNQQLVDKQNGNGDSRSWDEIFEQAKQMEKEQIIEAFSDGNSLIRMTPDECKQYYNETFNSNTNHNKQQ